MRIALINKRLLVGSPRVGEDIRIGRCTPIRIIWNIGVIVGITRNVKGFKTMTHNNKLVSWI